MFSKGKPLLHNWLTIIHYSQKIFMPRFFIHHVTKYTYPGACKGQPPTFRWCCIPLKTSTVKCNCHNGFAISDEPPLLKYTKIITGNDVGSFMNIARTVIAHWFQYFGGNSERAFPADDKPVGVQWHYLQETDSISFLISILKQEYFSKLDEVKQVANLQLFKEKQVLPTVQELNTLGCMII